jgi:hypothetical protein
LLRRPKGKKGAANRHGKLSRKPHLGFAPLRHKPCLRFLGGLDRDIGRGQLPRRLQALNPSHITNLAAENPKFADQKSIKIRMP